MSRSVSVMVWLLAVVCVGIVPVAGQTVVYDSVYSAAMGRKYAIAVRLPGEYADSTDKEYPVLYALHGQATSNYDAWKNMGPLTSYIENGHPMIIAMFNNEYALYRNEAPFFFGEWIPHIDSTYRTIATRNGRAVTGFSSGGYGAMHYAVIHPEYFTASCPMSAAFETVVGRELFSRIPDSLAAGRVLPPLFIQCGTEDFLLPENREMRDSLTAWDVPFEYEEDNGSHNWTYWRDHSGYIGEFVWEHLRLDTIPPGMPASLAADEGEHAIGLVWQAPAPASDGGVPVAYAVYRDGVEIVRTAQTAYIDAGLPAATSFLYRVVAFDAAGNASDSAGGQYVTAADVSGPRVVAVRSNGVQEVEVVFDEGVDEASATDADNYVINSGVSVVSARLLPDNVRVVLITSVQVAGQAYQLDVSGVADSTAAARVMDAASEDFVCRTGFWDDFESNSLDAWQAAAGWQVVDDAGDKSVMLAAPTGSEPLLAGASFGTFTCDAELRTTGTSYYMNGSIVFGYRDADNYYFANISGRSSSKFNGIMRVAGGSEEQIATRDDGIIGDTVVYRQVRVTADSVTGELAVYVNDMDDPVFSVTDPLYAGGRVGLWSRSKVCYFDNIKIVSRVRSDVFSGIRNAPDVSRNISCNGCSVFGNPMLNNALVVSFGNNEDGVAEVRDAYNRVVARVPVAAGYCRWDGTDRAGARVPAGVYFVCSTRADAAVRVVVLP